MAPLLLVGLLAGPAAFGATPLPAGGGTLPPGSLIQLECTAAEEATGVIRRTVVLHTDGDGRKDIIAQVDGELIWMAGPDPLQCSSTVGIDGVTSFAVLPYEGSLMSALIVTHGGGAEFVTRDLNMTRVFSPVRTPIGSADWAGARSVVTLDVDGDGDKDVLGLNADGTHLLRLDQTAHGAFVEQFAVDLGAELSELRAIRWTGGSEALAGIFHGSVNSACVLAPDGTLYLAHPFTQPIDDLAAITDAHAPGTDGLVVLSGGALTVLRPGGVIEFPVDVAPIAPTSMSVTDLDGDGLSDVLLNSSTTDQVTALLGQDPWTSGGATLVAPTAASAISIPLDQDGASMTGQRANPVGADFDLDGDIDVFQLIESTRGACVQRNVLVNENAQRPVIVESEWIEAPGGLLAFLEVDPMTMPDGLAPDRLEITLLTSLPWSEETGEEFLRLQTVHEVGSATTDAGDDLVTLQVSGELGEHSSLLIRGYRYDSVEDVIREVGVEASFRLEVIENSYLFGTGIEITASPVVTSGRQGTPPPRPPVLIDPFA